MKRLCSILFILITSTNLFSQIGAVRYVEGGKVGLLDNSGKIITEANFDQIIECTTGFFILIKSNKYGLIDPKGKIILKAKYNGIKEHGYYTILILKGKKYNIYDLNRNKFIKKWKLYPRREGRAL